MRKNIKKVIEAFKNGHAAVGDSKKTCSTDGKVIYSYRMPIAERQPNGKVRVVAYKEAPSQTTRQQVNAVSFVLRDQLDEVTL